MSYFGFLTPADGPYLWSYCFILNVSVYLCDVCVSVHAPVCVQLDSSV